MTMLRSNLTPFSNTLHDIFMTYCTLFELSNVVHGVHTLTLNYPWSPEVVALWFDVLLLSTKKVFEKVNVGLCFICEDVIFHMDHFPFAYIWLAIF